MILMFFNTSEKKMDIDVLSIVTDDCAWYLVFFTLQDLFKV